MRRFTRHLPRRLFLLLMLAGSAFITANSLAYFDFAEVAPFVIERLPEHFAALWLAALRVHVGAALVSLPLCLLLTTRWLQRRPAWHRWMGRAAGVLVLFALVPSGVVLAFHAKGGASVTAGFLLSAAIVAVAMVRGVLAARRRDIGAHRHAMRHVVGQMSVAVTSRALLLGLDAAGADPDVAYVIGLWVPVLATIAVVELLSLSPQSVTAWVTQLRKGSAVGSLRWLPWCALVFLFVPSFASAEEPSLADWVRTRVEDGLLKPLAEHEVPRFSRARAIPHESRVRVLRTTAINDKNGRPFVPFAVDVRFGGGEWKTDDIVGCAYVGKGDLFVKRGDAFRPAAFLLGKSVEPVPGVCEAAVAAPKS